MSKRTHLCLPTSSAADIIYPDLYCIELEVLEQLFDLVETAQRLAKTVKGFRHIEMDFDYGTWLFYDGEPSAVGGFLEHDPITDGWATDYNDDPDLAPLEGFSVRVNGHGIEFRCYEEDTGLESWSEPIYLRGDLVIFQDQAYNMRTDEVVTVDAEVFDD